jgi:quercetin dioxygenase-like cupin family protein
MTDGYTYIEDLTGSMDVPDEGILSRTIHDDDQLRAVLFGFAAGEELSEHTASQPAILHFLEGRARLTLGEDGMEVGAGTWVHMAPELRHSLHAETPTVMLLLLMKTPSDAGEASSRV